ncbi:hypothetical protein Tco_0963657, partial [Tanacetum coccineum]
VTNGSCLDNAHTYHEMVDEFAPPHFFALVPGMKHVQLFTEFNVGAVRQTCLSAEVRMHTEYNVRDKRRLSTECEQQKGLMGKKHEEISSLQAQLLLKEAEAAEAIRLRSQASALKVAEKSPWEEMDVQKEHNSALEKERDSLDAKVIESHAVTTNKEREVVDLNSIITFIKSHNNELVDQDKLAKLETKVVEAVLHLEETLCPCLLTTIASWRWLLTHGMKLIVVKCLNSPEYLSALRAFIDHAIKKGMQAGLAAGINHGKEGRSLADVVAYNLFANADYDTTMQQFHDVNFSLLSELKSCKDMSVEEVMNVLRLESLLIDQLRMSDMKPDVDQLMVPIHHFEDQVVLGSTSKSFSLSVLNSRVEKIRANIAAHSLPTPVAMTTALSTTFATTISIVPISIDDYEVVDAENVQRNDTSFLNFEEETLNTTL